MPLALSRPPRPHGVARLRLAAGAELGPALAEALAGGPPVAPLPADPAQRRRVEEMLQPARPLTERDAAAVVATSGSSGQPKGVVLSRTAIGASVAATHARLGGAGDWVLALPSHYVAGLMVLARAALAGTAVVEARSDLVDLPARAAALGSRRYLSLVPTQLRRALADPELVDTLAGFAAVLLGGAAVDEELLAEARALGIRLVTTYGMSETCGGCVYDGEPLDGVEVALDGERVLLGGASVFSGYRLRPDLTAAALREGRFRSEDRGRWRDGRLQVLGRLDDVVVTGGLNVDLAEVERRVQSWAARAGVEAAVVAVPDAEWGVRIVAVLDRPLTLDQLRSDLVEALPAYALPRTLLQLPALPRLSSGKVDREQLRALAEAER